MSWLVARRRWFFACLALFSALLIAPASFAAISRSADGTLMSKALAPLDGDGLRGRLAEARFALMELKAIVDQARQTIDLGRRLDARRSDNDRLRRTIRLQRTAMTGLWRDADPKQAELAALRGSIVDNWLESVRLRERSDGVERQLIESQLIWRSITERATALKRRLAEQRAALASLRAESAAIARKLADTRHDLARSRANAERLRREKQTLVRTAGQMRRGVTAALRSVLLEQAEARLRARAQVKPIPH